MIILALRGLSLVAFWVGLLLLLVLGVPTWLGLFLSGLSVVVLLVVRSMEADERP